jgi:hypothetical protein
MTTAEKAQAIKEKYNSVPEKQVATGIYLKSVGRRYVYLLNTWNVTSIDKVEIDGFYDNYIN